ncbi:Neutral alpha-glucosidase ab [Venustampulla echinocandica]|uniref:alpha-glucosidase n=1 Tax=Venustampulla echinocandica TaxID=2656787 RepID=A0A370TC43_9HELO|nr:Neutral alpha-glucosidase ab [Venustampulla echinocandica]RDL31823.1 Neutral alpha-glucosidase ab [Venustampulla echinocandica]
MPQREYIPRKYQLLQENGYAPKTPHTSTEVALESTDTDSRFLFTFQAVRPGLFRTTFSSKTHPLPPHPSTPRPTVDFQGIKPTSESARSKHIINIGDIEATVDWSDSPVVSLQLAGQEKPIHRDLQFRSYAVDSSGIAHYTFYKRDTLHVGLGEKAAPMNLANRHFILSVTDSFGYDVYRTDPLYKHIPLLINVTPEGCVAIFSTSHSRGTYSVGSEVDGLWGHFKVYRQDYGGLEEYIMVGKTVEDVVKIYADLVGYPKLVPRWAFGYIAGGMKYSTLDEPRASDALMEFAGKLKHYDIPCSAFQLSSGYTIAETEPKTRNVFTWNRHRFPDPEMFVADYHAEGIRIIANIKPYILSSHPEYSKLAVAGAFFTDPRTKKSGIARLWSAGGGESGEGGHIDFTSEFGFQWWYEGVQVLRKVGIEGIWNDNNEYTIPDDEWECDLNREDPTSVSNVGNQVGLWGRSLQCELMGKSSHDALVDFEPEYRPFVLTRSATAGTMRYAASSWSGDNMTSWDSMKGPQPSPELLLRWIQLGVHSPRFAINCFKTDENDNTIGGVIEPWMYPEITPLVRDAIKRRYELIPYLYSLMLESHMTALAPQRWIGWGYESDPEVWTPEVMRGETQYWLGDTILVGGVYEAGNTTARMYLPKSDNDDGYLNLHAPHQSISSGQWIDLESQWKDGIPLLARVGGAIVVGQDVQTRSPGDNRFPSANVVEDDYRALEIFPPAGTSSKIYSYTWYEDDGIASKLQLSTFTVKYSSTDDEVLVELSNGEDNKFVPVWKDLDIILPFGDKRTIITGSGPCRKGNDSRGRSVYTL